MTNSQLIDRALAAHQEAVLIRLAYEEAFLRVLTARETYDNAMRDWEQAKRAMKIADETYQLLLVELHTALKKEESHGEKEASQEGRQEEREEAERTDSAPHSRESPGQPG